MGTVLVAVANALANARMSAPSRCHRIVVPTTL